jgi:hypothetical protein
MLGESKMRLVLCGMAAGLLMATTACQDFADDFKGLPPVSDHPFADDGLNAQSLPTSCSATDQPCSSGRGSPSAQVPAP